jgi:hypothetical protein
MKYLGVPLSGSKLHVADWVPLYEKLILHVYVPPSQNCTQKIGQNKKEVLLAGQGPGGGVWG